MHAWCTPSPSWIHFELSFVSLFVHFCRSLLERMAGARLVYTQPSMTRIISFEYLNRQLVWHEISELLLLLLPLLDAAKLRFVDVIIWKRALFCTPAHFACTLVHTKYYFVIWHRTSELLLLLLHLLKAIRPCKKALTQPCQLTLLCKSDAALW